MLRGGLYPYSPHSPLEDPLPLVLGDLTAILKNQPLCPGSDAVEDKLLDFRR